MKTSLLLSAILFSLNASADGLLDGIGNLAEPYSSGLMKIIGNLSSSSKGDIQKPLTKDECAELLEEEEQDRSKRELHGVIYFANNFPERDLFAPYDLLPGCKDGNDFHQSKIGLKSYNRMRPSSYSKSILAESRCLKYLELEKVEVVKIQDAEGERNCRRMSLGLQDKKFYSYFCVGENEAYIDFQGIPAEVIKEIPYQK